MNFSTPRRRSD